ncbi:hypothetical protein [Phytohabitans rumicis]|uniref:Uncharacterized protein n=1 Tax=Phytohabitans rumicis TaxID=1076125 RepID=A0A6V8LIP9_9ACTN|nr:hypothetical protein [Phytohabitans rumicis]GFJ96074.1 hypothetical protein Prum_097160 [Phytohabitans rumicis]
MDRLTEITFRLPETPESRAFLADLRTLLRGVAAPGEAADRLTLTPARPPGALPVTTFALAPVSAPEITLDTGQVIGRSGDITGTPSAPARVEMADLTRRLAGHVDRVDHTGVNLPATTTSTEQWHALVGSVAAVSTMYRYPTGEEWPFVLPSTAEEFDSGIGDFVAGREPRFELVHDDWLAQPEWQFALGTDLTRAELERLFPEPEGVTFAELADVFRVVRVHHPWPGLSIRFDLCYRLDHGPGPWETGEWLVTEGGRIPPVAR